MKCFIFKDGVGEWRWHVKAKNGRIIATSGDGYKNKEHAIKMAIKLFRYSDVRIIW